MMTAQCTFRWAVPGLLIFGPTCQLALLILGSTSLQAALLLLTSHHVSLLVDTQPFLCTLVVAMSMNA